MTVLSAFGTGIPRRSALLLVLSAVAVAALRCKKDGTGPGGNPKIALASQSVTFAATAGGANPASQTVAVTNSGTGSLSGLSGSTSYGTGQPTGWLAATLDQTTAPATLTLLATTGTLAVGSYTATVSVASTAAGNSPQALTATLNVSGAPTIGLSPTSVTFNAPAGGANPASQTVAVTNSGTGTLSGLAVGTITYGTGQPSGWLGATLTATTAPTNLTLQTTGTLAQGSYTAQVPITSPAAGNSPQTVGVTFTVAGVPPMVSSVVPASGSTCVSRTAQVSATFSKPIDAATVTAATFIVSGPTGAVAGTLAVSADGLTASFTPAAALSAGAAYVATIKGGPDGVADGAGNRLQADYTWPFSANVPPAANAGLAQDVNRLAAVTLHGSATQCASRPLTYTWTQTFGPGVGPLSGATPTFTATNDIVTLQFKLQVSDGLDQSAPSFVTIWVLQDAAHAWWVAPGGNDANAGTRAAPLATIQAAIERANTAGWGGAYVAAGTYGQSLTLRPRVGVYGGYAAGTFLRDIATYTTTVNGGTTAVTANGATAVSLDGLTIRSANTAAPGGTSIGIALTASTGAVISRNTIVAGSGGAGTLGGAGTPGAAGGGGANGVDRNHGAAGTVAGGYSGGDGGDGGFGASFACFPGPANGAPGSGPFAGGGGAAGGNSGNGSPGGNGGGGFAGGQGAAGPGFGAVSGTSYFPANGANGAFGTAGSGGGGGGGGDCATNFFRYSGGGGGGGGAGGLAGRGGGAGGGGGGSFGILLTNGSTTASIVNNSITTNTGGAGGNGGSGGAGGSGGNSGAGGLASGVLGGSGGHGGAGGSGGSGGGGGGGPTIGVVEDATSSSNLTPSNLGGNTFVLGTSGVGGTPGGASGQRIEYRKS